MPNDHLAFRPARQMLDTICTLPLTSDVFTQSIHPTSPLIALGLASGHVQIQRLPPCRTTHGSPEPAADHGTIETVWRTHRHKESCRSLTFSLDGSFLFSAGADGIIKAATTETGRVVSKIAVPLYSHDRDPPTLIHTLSPQSLLVATDSSALHIYDLRTSAIFNFQLPQKTYNPHDDYVSSLSSLAPGDTSTSGFSKQWISTGGSSITITDLRKGVIKVEDLNEELLSSSVSKDGKVVVGGERGILKILESGKWQEAKKVVVEKGESLDVLCNVPEGTNGEGKEKVAVGMGDGTIKIVSIQERKVMGILRHDEVEGVIGVGFEVGGRMISSGGSVLKVWQENNMDGAEEEEPEEEEDEEGEEDEEKEPEVDIRNGIEDSKAEDEDESEAEKDDDDDDDDDSSEEEKTHRRRRKRRKRGKDKPSSSGNIHRNTIMAFKGLD